MNYEQTYSIGNYHDTRTATTKAVAPSVKRVRQLDAKAERYKRGFKRQTQFCTNSDATNGFLKSTFLPKLQETKFVQTRRKLNKTERDFFQSLSELSKYYNIEPLPSNEFSFPYNMMLALNDVEEKLKNKVLNWNQIRLIQTNRKIYILSNEHYNTGATLFYIPIVPLYRLLCDKKRKKNAHLLLSVCTYLYHIVNIPYYRSETSYLYWIYEMMNDWLEQDDYSEETKRHLSELKQAEFIGDFMEQRIYNYINLNVFEMRISKFKIKNDFDSECLTIAKEAFALYQTYPNENVFRNAKIQEEVCEEDLENMIGMEKYISFYADHKGWLNEMLIQSVNSEFQECSIIEEPTISKRFDGTDISNNNLCFENKLFELLQKLSNILNQL
ncbi:hypothetical protein H1R17_09710 [Flavobacterium sp. xlx-214]|uniref:hypothetical protein n=1 Tax=unclassified Flavobacterium TaxID=196869 RepID=UPI0013D29A20|nr:MULTISPECIES: hypothetical protein [unclassified Flavobacterium]MBA5793486.1 hypothetical protein [Flavobacterium sp. xlx-221]QMI82743.1 hypothetical protein H1R17_09710 [Flavobacterium sp. xlx-214]